MKRLYRSDLWLLTWCRRITGRAPSTRWVWFWGAITALWPYWTGTGLSGMAINGQLAGPFLLFTILPILWCIEEGKQFIIFHVFLFLLGATWWCNGAFGLCGECCGGAAELWEVRILCVHLAQIAGDWDRAGHAACVCSGWGWGQVGTVGARFGAAAHGSSRGRYFDAIAVLQGTGCCLIHLV